MRNALLLVLLLGASAAVAAQPHDGVLQPVWDTVATACTKLTVATNGNVGHAGIGGVNMNYRWPVECDTNGTVLGGWARGDASIFLYDGSPVVVRSQGVNSYAASWSMFNEDVTSAHGLRPVNGCAVPEHVSEFYADIFRSGTFCTADSLVKIEKTWYAPRGMADSCKFILVKTLFFPYTIDSSVSGLAIGEAIDWNVPSDSGINVSTGGYSNVAGEDWNARKMVWMRGFESADSISMIGECRNNSKRFAGMGVVLLHLRDCVSLTPYGGYVAASDSSVYPTGSFVPEELWAKMQVGGVISESRITDLHAMLTYMNVPMTGWTLPARDTLTVWTALISIPNSAYSTAGADSVKKQYDRAVRFLLRYGKGTTMNACSCCPCCAEPQRGNVNVEGIIDLTDLSMLIAYLTSSPAPSLSCVEHANVNAMGIVELADLSLLIAYLTATLKPALPPCPF